MTEAEIKTVVDRHNKLRRQEGSDNMELLTWNSSLAGVAETWARGCVFEHPVKAEHPEYTDTGQNIFMRGGERALRLPQDLMPWYNEKVDFDYETSTCAADRQCGHYQVMVFATATKIGCAYHDCEPLTGNVQRPQAMYLVCNYWPLIKEHPDDKEFTKGVACSSCKSGAGWCDDRLCNGECTRRSQHCQCMVVCYNCATVNETTCRCQCAAGWHSHDCTVRCDDTSDMCDPQPGQAGYSSADCSDPQSVVAEQCPAWCGFCQPDPDAVADKCPPVKGSGYRSASSSDVTTTSLAGNASSAAAASVNTRPMLVISIAEMMTIIYSSSSSSQS